MSCKCDTINIVNDNNVVIVSHADGRDGKSAYQLAVEGGYTGTEQEFNCSLSLLADVAEGKRQIAEAINTKGGEASADSSFSQLAEDIKEIPNFDQWARLAGVLAGNSHNKNALQGHEENVSAGSITKLTDPFGTFTEINSYAFQYWDLLEEIDLPYVTKINSYIIEKSAVTKINLPNLVYIGKDAFNNCKNIKKYNFPKVTTINGSSFANNSLEELYTPEANFISEIAFRGSSSIVNLVFGVLTFLEKRSLDTNKPNLRNITIGQGTNINLPLQYWSATNVIAEGPSGIDELNSNLRTNLLEKLYDHSQDGQTRTLSLGWLAHVTQENIDYANSKGWTLTT